MRVPKWISSWFRTKVPTPTPTWRDEKVKVRLVGGPCDGKVVEVKRLCLPIINDWFVSNAAFHCDSAYTAQTLTYETRLA